MIYSYEGNDTIYGGEGNDTIYAGEGNDYISVFYGDNIAFADAGNDRIYSGLGSDTIDGGDGIDHISYSGSDEGIILYLDGTISSGGYAEGDSVINVENIDGSNYDDYIYGNSSSNIIEGDSSASSVGADVIYGGDGHDTIYTANHYNIWQDVANTVYGENGLDVIYSAGNDTIDGGADNDSIYIIRGSDIVYGGLGDDEIFDNYSDTVADVIDGGDGIDTLHYSSNTSMTIYLDGTVCVGGSAEGDIITNIENINSGSYDDIIVGNDSNNKINGFYGGDTITGGTGNDIFLYNSASDSRATAYDTITDFTQGEDVMQFEAFEFGSDWKAFNVDNSSGTETVITHSTLTDFELHLTGTYTLNETDFSFV